MPQQVECGHGRTVLRGTDVQFRQGLVILQHPKQALEFGPDANRTNDARASAAAVLGPNGDRSSDALPAGRQFSVGRPLQTRVTVPGRSRIKHSVAFLRRGGERQYLALGVFNDDPFADQSRQNLKQVGQRIRVQRGRGQRAVNGFGLLQQVRLFLRDGSPDGFDDFHERHVERSVEHRQVQAIGHGSYDSRHLVEISARREDETGHAFVVERSDELNLPLRVVRPAYAGRQEQIPLAHPVERVGNVDDVCPQHVPMEA